MGDCTLVCAWSAEEAARYIETIKANPYILICVLYILICVLYILICVLYILICVLYILICVLYILNLEPLEHWTINNVSSTLNLRPYTKF